MSQRLEAIDAAIRRAPDSAENYLLRGEVLLDRGRRGDDLAAAVDLYRALKLAERQLALADWGIAPQIIIDQAGALLNDLAERGIVIEIAESAPPEAASPQPAQVTAEPEYTMPDPATIPEPYPLTGGALAQPDPLPSDDFENVPPDGTMQANTISDDPGRRTME